MHRALGDILPNQSLDDLYTETSDDTFLKGYELGDFLFYIVTYYIVVE